MPSPTTKSNHPKIAFYPTDIARKTLQKKMEQTGKNRTDAINDAICIYGEIEPYINKKLDDLVTKIRAVLREELDR